MWCGVCTRRASELGLPARQYIVLRRMPGEDGVEEEHDVDRRGSISRSALEEEDAEEERGRRPVLGVLFRVPQQAPEAQQPRDFEPLDLSANRRAMRRNENRQIAVKCAVAFNREKCSAKL